jgi:hypothetical protein
VCQQWTVYDNETDGLVTCLASDGTNLVWNDALVSPGGFYQVPLAGGATTTLGNGVPGGSVMAIANGKVYMLTSGGEVDIYQATLGTTNSLGKFMTALAATSSQDNYGFGLALNPTATDLYFVGKTFLISPQTYTHFPMHCVVGGSCNMLSPAVSGQGQIGSYTLYVGGYVFWDMDGTLTRYQPSTNQSTTLSGVYGNLFTDGTYVYYSGTGTTIVRLTPSTMATQNTISIPTGYAPLATDGTFVYSSPTTGATTVTATPFGPTASFVLSNIQPTLASVSPPLLAAGGFLMWTVDGDVSTTLYAERYP